MGYGLEAMEAGHGRAVMGIFNHYTLQGFAAYFERPVPEAAFERWLEATRGYPAFVAREEGGEVVGFGFLRPFHPGGCLRRTAEITYFIHPEHTRRGLGGMLLRRLVEEGRKLGVDNLVASVSSRNEESLAFHRKQGFAGCGRLKRVGRKFGEEFDVVWMQRGI